MQSYHSLFLAFLSCTTLYGAAPSLDIVFDKPQTIATAGKTISVEGPFRTLSSGEKVLVFGEKGISIPAKNLLGKQGTIFAKVAIDKFSVSRNAKRPLITLRTRSRLSIEFVSFAGNPVIQYNFADQKNNFYYSDREKIVPGKLYSIAMTWDGEKIRCWQNGQLIREADQPLEVDEKAIANLEIGPYRDPWYIVPPWNNTSMISTLKVYDKALNASEIATLSGKEHMDISEKYSQVITAPKRTGNITADGNLDDNGWKNAASILSLVNFMKEEDTWLMPPHHARFTWDENNLYIGFDSTFPSGSVIQKGPAPGDKESGLWIYESFEIHLRHHGQTYYFAGCVGGAKTETRNKEKNYNPEWIYRTTLSHRIDDTELWKGECVIPWKALELEAPPKEGLRMNFCRTWTASTYSAYSDLAAQRGKSYWADTERFFLLKFADAAPTVSLPAKNNPAFGHIEQTLEFLSAADAQAVFSIIQENRSGLLQAHPLFVRELNLKAGVPLNLEVAVPITSTQTDRLIFSLADRSGREIFFRQILPVVLSREYISIAERFTAGKILANVKLPFLRTKFGHDFQGSLRLVSPDKKCVLQTPVTETQPQALPFPRNNAVGNWKLQLTDASGKSISESSFFFPGFGSWSIRQEDNRIIPPYTPLKIVKKTQGWSVAPWGRSYIWDGDGLMPSQIVSQKKELFSEPAELLVNGKRLRSIFHAGKTAPHRAEFSGSGSGHDFTLKSKSWIEYDGVQYNTVELKAEKKLSHVELRFTLPRKIAKYLHTSAEGWGNKLTRSLENGKFQFRYYPVVFLGNEDKGFCFFAESNSSWKTGSRPFSVTADSKNAVLTVRIADSLTAGETLKFEFGLLAAPVKALPENYPLNILGWDHCFAMNRPGRRPVIWTGYLTQTWKTLSDAFADLPTPETSVMPKVKAAVKNAIRQNVAFPFSYNLANYLTEEYPETGAFLDEWKLIPQRVLNARRNGKMYSLYGVCPNSQAADFFLYKLKKNLAQTGMQALNLDFGLVPVCSNKLHGCYGHTPILAYRDLLRRIALALLDAGDRKEYVLDLHSTDSVQLPCFTFATHLGNGENIRQQSSSIMHGGKDILDTYRLPMFACEFNSLPFGLSNGGYQANDVLLPEFGGGKEDPELYKLRITRAFLTGTLVHNTILRLNRCHYGIFDKILRIYDNFDVPHARFIGYWDERKVAEVIKGEEVYVSCYRHKNGKKLLAVISHLGKQRLDQDVTIRFHPKNAEVTADLCHAVERIDAEDPLYAELFEIRAKNGVAPKRAPLKWQPAGVRILEYSNHNLKLHLPAHTFALVELE